MRQTSIDIYRHIEENGLLSKRRLEVYQCLYHHGPLSQNETSYKLRGKLDWGINPRFVELERMGAIKAVGERLDRHSGNNVTVWDVTSQIPKRLDKSLKPTRAMKLKEAHRLLAEMVEHLDRQANVPPRWQDWALKAKKQLGWFQ